MQDSLRAEAWTPGVTSAGKTTLSLILLVSFLVLKSFYLDRFKTFSIYQQDFIFNKPPVPNPGPGLLPVLHILVLSLV